MDYSRRLRAVVLITSAVSHTWPTHRTASAILAPFLGGQPPSLAVSHDGCICNSTHRAPLTRAALPALADGTYYLCTGGTTIKKLANTHSMPSPPSPAPTSSLPSCGMTTIINGKSTSPITLDVSAWGLNAAAMNTAYGLTTSCATSECYMNVWTYNSGTDSAATRLEHSPSPHAQPVTRCTPRTCMERSMQGSTLIAL